MKARFFVLAALVAVLVCAEAALADDFPVTIGDTTDFTAGTNYGTATFLTDVGAAGSPAPFNAFCGSDTSSTLGNCSASWTFSDALPGGSTITSATLTIGILDLDSAASGDQIASFTLNGTDDLTSLLNAAAEGLNAGAGAPNGQYDVLAITIPGTDFADLLGGTDTFALTLQGPGLGVLGNTTYNGAGLAFSTLDIQATPGTNNGGGGTTTPEPATLMLLGAGLLGIGGKRRFRK